MTNNISLYFHIPFCVRKCDYCAFYSLPDQGEEIKQEYFNALLRQIDFFDTDKTVSTVYFGGGTPPLLGIDRLCAIIDRVFEKFNIAEDAEITVEINPGTIDRDGLLKLFNAGVNRLSVGVQSADDGILKSIGRIHDFAQAKKIIEDARETGFINISCDVIFALPGQSLESFKDSLLNIMSTEPDHISAYSLQLEEGTPLFLRKDEVSFPDEDAEEGQYDALCELLAENGYEHYEISSFARKGKRSRHNGNYWRLGEYFGFGAAAHSFFEGRRFSAVCDVTEFIEKSYISAFAPTDHKESEVTSLSELSEERIMLGLRTDMGAIIPEDRHKVAEAIAKMGYGSFENGRLVLNSRGFRVSNEIISEILI